MEKLPGLKIAIILLIFILILRFILKGWQKAALRSTLPFGERIKVRGYVS
jgi:hypothetical protein